ncbi:uncharacterized protein LOC126976021 isoform X1 [Leptidea sinapis]|uniref:uncharacterized protein LOC126976021 isoform X1 n=1 Tax=Leptidea sinapis TaxID=189913 RepID=UPI0021356F68|nr:uncharacterized protein LOC126976021 isoform X1 [Leptidea sinapis]
MQEDGKLPLKRVELSLTKFNDVAIPHHLDLLRQHKANILKYEELGQYARVRSEQTHARRVASQLRSLLGELEALRRGVRPPDRARFDALTQGSRERTLAAIMDYLGVIERSCIALVDSSRPSTHPRPLRTDTSPLSINRAPSTDQIAASVRSTDSVGIVPDTVQLQVDLQEISIREREEVLAGWSALQSEVRALHDAWQHVQAAALAQRDQVTRTSEGVELAAENVQVARSHLAAAERLRAGAYGVCGAVAGAMVGGPLGAVLGAKVGAAALVAGSALGYFAARSIRRRTHADLPTDPPTDTPTELKKEL